MLARVATLVAVYVPLVVLVVALALGESLAVDSYSVVLPFIVPPIGFVGLAALVVWVSTGSNNS